MHSSNAPPLTPPSRPQKRSHYDVLKVSSDAPPEVVQAAYRCLARLLHPDTNPDDSTGARVRAMQELNAAYAVLGDPGKRRAYDKTLAQDQRIDASQGQQPSAAPSAPAYSPEVTHAWARAAQERAVLMQTLQGNMRLFALKLQRERQIIGVVKVVIQVTLPIAYGGFTLHFMHSPGNQLAGWCMLFVGGPVAFGCFARLIERLYR